MMLEEEGIAGYGEGIRKTDVPDKYSRTVGTWWIVFKTKDDTPLAGGLYR